MLGYGLAVSMCFLDLIVISYVAKKSSILPKRKKEKKEYILSNLSKITQSVNHKGVDYTRTDWDQSKGGDCKLQKITFNLNH